MGWVTVLAYFLVAWLAFVNARINRNKPSIAAHREVLFWVGLTVLMVALGINKQLDLQSLMTDIGRVVAREYGWYERRHDVQIVFIGVLATSALGFMLGLLWLLRDSLQRVSLAIVGVALLLAFVAIRASSFHGMDRLIGWEFFGIRMNWVLELGALALIGANAWLLLRNNWQRS
jgi:hypothetical protein